MTGFFVILLVGLVVSGCLIYRHHVRTAGIAGASPQPPTDLSPGGGWQPDNEVISTAPVTWESIGRARVLERLRKEEEKQRPQEQRN